MNKMALMAALFVLGGTAFADLPSIPYNAEAVDISLPTIPGRTFVITDYGAVADDKTLNTSAFASAIAACKAAGGGRVVVPAGEFLTGPIELVSRMDLHLEKNALVRFSDDPALYGAPSVHNPGGDDDAETRSMMAPISGSGLIDIAITGQGTIDGNGKAWWVRGVRKFRADGKPAEAPLPRPILIHLTKCKRVLLENLTLCNSPQFHVVPNECDGVICRNLKIVAPPLSPNTDGIDPSNSRNVLITRCMIDCGDDNVSFKAWRDENNKITAPTENITVTDCTFLHGHGVSVGSRVWSGVRNILVDQCTFDGTGNGIRIKSARDRGGVMENITYSNITMKNVGTAITINTHYFDHTKGSKPVTPETPIVRNVRIRNVTVTGAGTAGDITGLPEMPVSDVVMENVVIACQTGMQIKDAKDIEFRGVQIKAKTGKRLTLENVEVKGIESFSDTTPGPAR